MDEASQPELPEGLIVAFPNKMIPRDVFDFEKSSAMLQAERIIEGVGERLEALGIHYMITLGEEVPLTTEEAAQEGAEPKIPSLLTTVHTSRMSPQHLMVMVHSLMSVAHEFLAPEPPEDHLEESVEP